MLSRALWALYIGAKGLACGWREIDEFAQLSPEAARLQLAAKLLAQVRHFGTRDDALPEWREAARIGSPLELWKHWHELPVVTKDLLRTRFEPRQMQSRFGLRGIASSTGGSTGEPLQYFHDREMLRSCSIRALCSRRSIGWRPGMPTIAVWGSERDIGRKLSLRHRVSAFLRNECQVSGYNIGPHTTDSVLRLIERYHPVALYGFTSMLEFVARDILDRGLRVPQGAVAVAWNGGEMLFRTQADIFLNAFGTPLLNFYGCRELGALAYQKSPEGSLLVLQPHVFVEVLNKDNREAAPNESGRLIWTSTVSRGTPFLRYQIGDLGCYRTYDRDESGIRALSELHGRDAGLLELPDRRTINCIYWNHLLKEFPEVHQFQVALSREGSLELRLKGAGFSSAREQSLRATLGNFLGDVPLRITWMERIPLTPHGKLLQVIRS